MRQAEGGATHILLEPAAGVAGDMFVAAFLDSGLIQQDDLRRILGTVVPEVSVDVDSVARCEIQGTKFSVNTPAGQEQPGSEHSHDHDHHGDHGHYHYPKIVERIQAADLPPTMKEVALAIFEEIAVAEAKAHNKTDLMDVVFHEVGAFDSLADILCAAFCIDRYREGTWVCLGSVALGGGMINFSHGKMPVPAPATMEILKGVPTQFGPQPHELTTPTGAAIVKVLTKRFGLTFQETYNNMVAEKIGYGHGTRNPPDYMNSLRLIAGKIGNREGDGRFGLGQHPRWDEDEVIEIEANIDDVAPNFSAAAVESFLEAGALDVAMVPGVGKKGRQTQVWRVLCEPRKLDDVAEVYFEMLGTIGVRFNKRQRYKLLRSEGAVTVYREVVRTKKVSDKMGRTREYPETDDVLAISKKRGIPPRQVMDAVSTQLAGGTD